MNYPFDIIFVPTPIEDESEIHWSKFSCSFSAKFKYSECLTVQNMYKMDHREELPVILGLNMVFTILFLNESLSACILTLSDAMLC